MLRVGPLFVRELLLVVVEGGGGGISKIDKRRLPLTPLPAYHVPANLE